VDPVSEPRGGLEVLAAYSFVELGLESLGFFTALTLHPLSRPPAGVLDGAMDLADDGF